MSWTHAAIASARNSLVLETANNEAKIASKPINRLEIQNILANLVQFCV
ncbi:MAG: hypothetical protein AAF298_04835 [Cyanobacteria bacterium P01_A01_bin.40]